jgi:hypothetical protein
MGLMFKCERCPATGPEVAGQGWGAVLEDGDGKRPRIVCPKCADKFQEGWDVECDPKTGVVIKRFQRDYDSVLSRF